MKNQLLLGSKFSFSKNRNKAALSIETTHSPQLLEPSSPPDSTSDEQQQQQQQNNAELNQLTTPLGPNLMPHPHNNPSTLSHKAGIGAGAFVYKVYNVTKFNTHNLQKLNKSASNHHSYHTSPTDATRSCLPTFNLLQSQRSIFHCQ